MSKNNELTPEERELRKRIGYKINELRAERGISEEALGNALGVSQKSINYIEAGERPINGETLIRAAQYFGVTTDYILGLSPARSSEKGLEAAMEYTGLPEDRIRALYDISCPPGETLGYKIFERITRLLTDDALLYLTASACVFQTNYDTFRVADRRIRAADTAQERSTVSAAINDNLNSMELQAFRVSRYVQDYLFPELQRGGEVEKLRCQYLGFIRGVNMEKRERPPELRITQVIPEPEQDGV